MGGLSLRYDEDHHYDIEVNGAEVVARARLATITDERRMPLPPGPVVLFVEARKTDGEFIITSDLIALGFVGDAGPSDVAVFDGRFLTAEPTGSFTGRVAGMYCVSGELGFDWYHEEGSGDVG